MTDLLIKIISIVAGIILFVMLIYGLTYLGKVFSYEFFYEDMNVWTMCEHVKPEALIDPSICE